MVLDFDDFGVDKVISSACQVKDCRDKLDQLHYANPAFKVTLFAVPGYMTPELLVWCDANRSWVELAVHGFYHPSNYECEKMSYEEFDEWMQSLSGMVDQYFVKGFKAPGWQISDDIYRWLVEHDWWVADQDYNTHRRPAGLKAYINRDNEFFAEKANGEDWTPVEAWHGHTWDCVGNGIYETYDRVEGLVKAAESFQFVSEVLQ